MHFLPLDFDVVVRVTAFPLAHRNRVISSTGQAHSDIQQTQMIPQSIMISIRQPPPSTTTTTIIVPLAPLAVKSAGALVKAFVAGL